MLGAINCLVPPSAVSLCLTACLLPNHIPHLLVIKTNWLEVYFVNAGTNTLRLHSRYRFYDRIASITTIPHPLYPELDRLLVSFREAKAAVLEFNLECMDWVNKSFYFFERPENVNSFDTRDVPLPKLVSDPEHRCTAMRIYQSFCAIFITSTSKNDSIGDEQDEDGDASMTNNLQYFKIRFEEIDERLQNVKDFCFLPGFHEPTLAILHESGESTTCTRLETKKDTFQVTIVSVDLDSKTFSTIHHVEGLPYDCEQLVVLSRSIGGFLVTSANALLHIEPGSPGYGISLNAFTEKTTNFKLQKSSTMITNLHGSSLCLLPNQKNVLLCTLDGKVYGITLGKIGRFVNKLEIESLEIPFQTSFTGPACLCTYNEFVFFGSSTSDAYLLGVSLSKKSALTDLDEDDLYSASTPKKLDVVIPDILKPGIKVLDTLYSCAPLTTFSVSNDGDIVIPSCKNGPRLNILMPKLRFEITGSLCISGARSIWTLYDQDGYAKHLVVSTDTATMLLKATSEGGLAEVEESEFFLEGPTYLACNLSDGTALLQVHSRGISLIDSDLCVVSMIPFELVSEIVKVMYLESFLFILLSDGSLMTFSVDKDQGLKPFEFSSDIKYRNFSLCKSTRFGPCVALYGIDCMFMIVSLSTGQSVFSSTTFIALPPIITNTDYVIRCPDEIKHFILTCIQNVDYLFVVTNDGILRIYRLLDDGFYDVEVSGSVINALNLIEYSKGVILTGKNPCIIQIGKKTGYPRAHTLRDSISMITSFPIPSVSNNFVMILPNGILNIGHIRDDIDLDCDIPTHRSSPLLEHGHIQHMTYHSPSDAYMVAIATPHDFQLPQDEFAPLSDNQSYVNPKEPFPNPESLAFKIGLVSPINWSLIETVKLEGNHEHVTCMRTCSLETKSTSSGRKLFVVIGTAHVKSEDRPSRGRILVYDIMHVVPQENRPETNRKLRLLRAELVRGPVTAVAAINGHVLACIGTKIIIHSFEDNETLDGVAFIDLASFVSSVSVAKNFFTIGDICSSISFLVFQEDPPKLVVLGKDFKQDLSAGCTEYMIEGQELMMVVSDTDDALHFFQYAPSVLASLGGEKLLEKGGLGMFSLVSYMSRLITSTSIGLLIGTVDGTISVLMPIPTDVFQRSFALTCRLSGQTPPYCGLNPRQSRIPNRWAANSSPSTTLPALNIIDLNLYKEYWHNARIIAPDSTIDYFPTTTQSPTNKLDDMNTEDEKFIIVSGLQARHSIARLVGAKYSELMNDFHGIMQIMHNALP